MKDRKNNKPAELRAHSELREQIKLRAHHIWVAGGGDHGNDIQHWLQAEKEIMASVTTAGADSHKSWS
jgi:hypothetical protein